MSLYDDFRATAAELFSLFGVPATITSTGEKTRDFVTGTVVAAPTATRNVLAVLGKRRTVADDGRVVIQTTARANGPAKSGDTITIGSQSYQIGDVEDVAPDGGQPMQWVFVLQ